MTNTKLAEGPLEDLIIAVMGLTDDKGICLFLDHKKVFTEEFIEMFPVEVKDMLERKLL